MMEVRIRREGAVPVGDRIVVLTAGLGMFLSTLDTGIINVALPSLGGVFHAAVSTMAWTVTLYLAALSATIVLFGRLGDRYGRVPLFARGLVVFGGASVACGAAWSAETLVLFRALQGLGAAMMQATAAALITTRVAPERRGAALGTLGVMIGLGPVLGPAAGGLLLSTAGWRWIFWINIPICLAGLWGCRRLAGHDERGRALPLDGPGNLLFAGAMLFLLQGLAMWPAGPRHPATIVPLLLCGVCIALLLLWERRVAHPVIDLRLWRTVSFTVPVLAAGGLGAATAVAFIVPPYFLERIAHLAPWRVGFVSLAAPLGLALLAQVSGRAMRRRGARALMVTGLATMLAPLVVLAALQESWPPAPIALLLFVYGVGAGLFVPPNIAAVMGTVPRDRQGTIGAVQRMVQNVGIAVGTAIAAVFIQTHAIGRQDLIAGFRAAWIFAAALILLNLLSFAALWKRLPA